MQRAFHNGILLSRPQHGAPMANATAHGVLVCEPGRLGPLILHVPESLRRNAVAATEQMARPRAEPVRLIWTSIAQTGGRPSPRNRRRLLARRKGRSIRRTAQTR